MTPETAIVLGSLVIAMILFATERLSVDVVALGLVVALVGSGILAPAEAFSGFGSEVIIVLACIMILAGAIVKAGVMERLGQLAHRAGHGNERLSVLSLLAIAAGSSAVLSNTNTTAILMPAAIETARREKISPRRVLMPLSFASMLGGAGTLIGTLANLAGSGMAEDLGLEPFALFEFIGVGAVITAFGLAMDQSGAAEFLADHIVAWCMPFGPYAALPAFSLLTVLLSQPMSNAAAALTVIPVAVAAADGLGLDPRMLAVLVTLSASVSFISPLEPACLLVHDAGRYSFLDYARAGTPLTIICVVLLLIIVPWAWG